MNKQSSTKPTSFVVFLAGTITASPALAASAAIDGAPTPEGYPANFDSLIALGIVLTALACAWLLNHQQARLRAAGSMLAAMACFGIAAWFGAVLQLGVLENPKPNQAPMDSLKPGLLWTQATVALVAGLALSAIALRQLTSVETLKLGLHNETERYGKVSRVLHWTTAILCIFMIPTGIFSSMIPEGVWYRTEYNVIHKTIGIVILLLVLIRIVWNRLSPRPALDASLQPRERKMAHIAHNTLYGLLFALPLTGYVMTSMHGYPSYLFTLKIPALVGESDAYIYWGLFHKYLLQYLVYIVLGAHILGALKHQFIDKHDSAFKRMVA